MILAPEICYRAVRARDARFDGRFFVAVSSTRIYCRPVCTVRAPRPEHCRFFPSAAAAEAAGYRPCLRCRPELAPGRSSIDALERLARGGARLIEDGVLDDEGLAGLARRLGVSDRHLRRVFRSEFGVSPSAFARTQRLLLAKRLLTDTGMAITEVAYASGFGSLRRFNAAFRECYRLAPGSLRRAGAAAASSDALVFALAYRPPYDWPAMLAFLGARAVTGVEAVTEDAYRRTVAIARGSERHAGWIELRAAAGRPALVVALSPGLAGVIPQVLGRVRELADLACDPAAIAAALGPLAASRPGLRLPGAFDGFELAVRAVLGQQVSVATARTLTGRLAQRFGMPLATPHTALGLAFPAAATLAAAPAAAFAGCGITGARVATLQAVARACAAGTLDLSPGADLAATLARLRELPGIGEWTAQTIAMRALAWPDAFPHTDRVLLRAMGETRPARALATAEAWRPWRAYAALHLWHSVTPGAEL